MYMWASFYAALQWPFHVAVCRKCLPAKSAIWVATSGYGFDQLIEIQQISRKFALFDLLVFQRMQRCGLRCGSVWWFKEWCLGIMECYRDEVNILTDAGIKIANTRSWCNWKVSRVDPSANTTFIIELLLMWKVMSWCITYSDCTEINRH